LFIPQGKVYIYIQCGLIMDGTKNYCKHCGSTLGIDCGEAEPDYNKSYCSEGCFKMALTEHLFGDMNDNLKAKFILEL